MLLIRPTDDGDGDGPGDGIGEYGEGMWLDVE